MILILDASSSMSAHWPEVKNGVKKMLSSFLPHITRYLKFSIPSWQLYYGILGLLHSAQSVLCLI